MHKIERMITVNVVENLEDLKEIGPYFQMSLDEVLKSKKVFIWSREVDPETFQPSLVIGVLPDNEDRYSQAKFYKYTMELAIDFQKEMA